VGAVVTQGADKSLARPGRKQTTATQHKRLQATQKQFRRLSVQPGLRGSNGLRVGRKLTTFQSFFQSGRAKDLSAPLYLVSSLLGQRLGKAVEDMTVHTSSYVMSVRRHREWRKYWFFARMLFKVSDRLVW